MSMRGSTAPIPGEPEQGVELRCENGHVDRMYLQGLTHEMAFDYAAMIDGSHPMFVNSPRDDPDSPWGRCQARGNNGHRCGARFQATPFGYA